MHQISLRNQRFSEGDTLNPPWWRRPEDALLGVAALYGNTILRVFMVYGYSYSNLWFMVLSAKILWFMGIQTPPKTPSWRMVVLLLWARLQRLVILSALLEAKTMRVSFDEFCIGPTV